MPERNLKGTIKEPYRNLSNKLTPVAAGSRGQVKVDTRTRSITNHILGHERVGAGRDEHVGLGGGGDVVAGEGSQPAVVAVYAVLTAVMKIILDTNRGTTSTSLDTRF